MRMPRAKMTFIACCAAGLTALAAGRPATRPLDDRVTEAAATRPAGTLPVRWTAAVPMAAGDWPDVAKLLDRPVDIHTDKKMVLVEGKDEKSPTTGTEYLKLRDAGYTFKTNYDNMKEAWFKAATLPLVWLSRCKPARQSFLRDFDPAKDPQGTLAILPASVGFDLASQHTDGLWMKAWPGSTAKATAQPREIDVRDHEGGQTILQVLAWGDSNGDGVEDCLLLVANYATEGTFKSYQYVTVTRRQANGPIVVLADDVK